MRFAKDPNPQNQQTKLFLFVNSSQIYSDIYYTENTELNTSYYNFTVRETGTGYARGTRQAAGTAAFSSVQAKTPMIS